MLLYYVFELAEEESAFINRGSKRNHSSSVNPNNNHFRYVCISKYDITAFEIVKLDKRNSSTCWVFSQGTMALPEDTFISNLQHISDNNKEALSHKKIELKRLDQNYRHYGSSRRHFHQQSSTYIRQ